MQLLLVYAWLASAATPAAEPRASPRPPSAPYSSKCRRSDSSGRSCWQATSGSHWGGSQRSCTLPRTVVRSTAPGPAQPLPHAAPDGRLRWPLRIARPRPLSAGLAGDTGWKGCGRCQVLQRMRPGWRSSVVPPTRYLENDRRTREKEKERGRRREGGARSEG